MVRRSIILISLQTRSSSPSARISRELRHNDFMRFWVSLCEIKTKALFTLGARVRALCSGTKKDVIQTPWCLRSNRVLLLQFSARHFVCCIVRRHEEKTWELTKSCSDQCPCPGTMPEYYPWRQSPCPGTVPRVLLGNRQKARFRQVPGVPENRERHLV